MEKEKRGGRSIKGKANKFHGRTGTRAQHTCLDLRQSKFFALAIPRKKHSTITTTSNRLVHSIVIEIHSNFLT